MSRTTIGRVAGAAIVIAGGTAFAAYEVQGKMMPNLLFWLIVISATIVVVTASVSWLFAMVALPVFDHLSVRYGVRLPIYRKRPTEHQWLLDAVREQRNNIPSRLIVAEQSVNLTFLEYDEPYIVITYWIPNGSIFPSWITCARCGQRAEVTFIGVYCRRCSPTFDRLDP